MGFGEVRASGVKWNAAFERSAAISSARRERFRVIRGSAPLQVEAGRPVVTVGGEPVRANGVENHEQDVRPPRLRLDDARECGGEKKNRESGPLHAPHST